MQVILSSRNPSKKQQIEGLFAGSPINLLSLDDLGVEGEAVEDGRTLEENALKKAMFAYKQTGQSYWAMADDTGLFVDAWGGAPGVDAAIWAGTKEKTTTEFVLAQMAGQANRGATFATVVAIISPEGTVFTFKGDIRGTLRDKILVDPQPQMPYSPLFQPDGHERVWAEMGTEEENAISHRGKAFRQVRDFLEKYQ